MINRTINAGLLFASLAIWGTLQCQPLPAPHPPSPDADAAEPLVPDAGYDGPTSPVAECACNVLEWVGCEEGLPTRTETCPQRYTRVNNFPGMKIDGECICKARSIVGVRTCGVKCK